MSRKKHRKQDKIQTVPPHDEIKTVPNNAVTKFNIEFVPIIIDPETGNFENIHLFEQLLSLLEETSHIFGDDSMPKVENYSEWLECIISFIKSIQPWVFGVLVDGVPQGLLWAYSWNGNGPSTHSVVISGANKRKTPLMATNQAIKKLVSMIFSETPVYIIRSGYTEDNRAAGLALTRAGLSHPESERATMIRNGQEVTGIIKSITRPEWEAKNV